MIMAQKGNHGLNYIKRDF